MYTQVFYLTEGTEQTKFFLQSLPYESKFDNTKVVPFDVILNKMAQITDSICVKTVTIDAVIEWYSQIWAKSKIYRFFFLYSSGRYALYIVESQTISNGVVTNKLPRCKVLYHTAMTSLEMALDIEKMDKFTQEIQLELEITTEIDTQKIYPASVLITTVDLYQVATAKAKALQPKLTGVATKDIKDTLVNHGLWDYIKGRVCAVNPGPQKQMLPSIYKALLSERTLTIEELLAKVEEHMPSDLPNCHSAIKKVKYNYEGPLIAVNFRQTMKES